MSQVAGLMEPGVVPNVCHGPWVQFTHGVFYVKNGDTANYAVFYEQLCWGKGAREHEAATQADFLFFATVGFLARLRSLRSPFSLFRGRIQRAEREDQRHERPVTARRVAAPLRE